MAGGLPMERGPEDNQVQLAGFVSALVVTAFNFCNPTYERDALNDDMSNLVTVPQAVERVCEKVPIMLVRKNVEWLRAEFTVLRNVQLERQRQVNQLNRIMQPAKAGVTGAKPAKGGGPVSSGGDEDEEARAEMDKAAAKLEDVKRKLKRRQDALKQQEKELARMEERQRMQLEAQAAAAAAAAEAAAQAEAALKGDGRNGKLGRPGQGGAARQKTMKKGLAIE